MKIRSTGETIRGIGRVSALLTCALATSAQAQPVDIVRHANPENPQALILQAVTIPPSAEILMLSGVVPLPIDPSDKAEGLEAYGDTRAQTISVFNRIEGALAARGYTMSDVVRLNVYLVGDPRLGGKMDLAGMNSAYRTFFGTSKNPSKVARTTVQVAALGAPHFLVEIEATAAKAR